VICSPVARGGRSGRRMATPERSPDTRPRDPGCARTRARGQRKRTVHEVKGVRRANQRFVSPLESPRGARTPRPGAGAKGAGGAVERARRAASSDYRYQRIKSRMIAPADRRTRHPTTGFPPSLPGSGSDQDRRAPRTHEPAGCAVAESGHQSPKNAPQPRAFVDAWSKQALRPGAGASRFRGGGLPLVAYLGGEGGADGGADHLVSLK